MKWTDDRVKELEDFRYLITELSSLNNTSNAFEKLQECIKISQKLKESDIVNLKISFIDFIKDEAINDRENNL